MSNKNSKRNIAATAAASMKTGTGTPKRGKVRVAHAKAEKPATKTETAAAAATTGKKIGKGTAKAKGGAAKPAKKAAAKRASGAPRGPRVLLDESLKISGVQKENPHREGTGQFKRFEAARGAKNAGEWVERATKAKALDNPYQRNYLQYAAKNGWLKLG